MSSTDVSVGDLGQSYGGDVLICGHETMGSGLSVAENTLSVLEDPAATPEILGIKTGETTTDLWFINADKTSEAVRRLMGGYGLSLEGAVASHSMTSVFFHFPLKQLDKLKQLPARFAPTVSELYGMDDAEDRLVACHIIVPTNDAATTLYDLDALGAKEVCTTPNEVCSAGNTPQTPSVLREAAQSPTDHASLQEKPQARYKEECMTAVTRFLDNSLATL